MDAYFKLGLSCAAGTGRYVLPEQTFTKTFPVFHGAVYPDGRWWLRWRRREHAGHAASTAQARRFMARWLHAHRHLPPLLEADRPPKTLVPLQQFLREYETWGG